VPSLISAGNTRQIVDFRLAGANRRRGFGQRQPDRRTWPTAGVAAVGQWATHDLVDTSSASPSLGTTRSSRNLVSPPCGQCSHGTARLVGLSTLRRPFTRAPG